MERHIRDTLEEEVIYDHAQFGLLNEQTDCDVHTSQLINGNKPKSQQTGLKKWGSLIRTLALCAAYFSLGLCMSVTGPTLPYLQEQVGATIKDVSYIFTGRSVGVLCGSLFGGLVLDRCNRYSLLFIVIAAMAIGIGAMPWCRHLWMLIVSSSLIGIGGGFLDTGASVLCLELWGRDSGPYMQAMHFTFALGGSVAPLLVQAFIGNTEVPTASTYSSRHVRSITEPFNLTDSSDAFNETLSSVLDAVTPSQFDLITPTQPFNSTETFNATTTTTMLPPLPDLINGTTTISPDAALKKPKRPKPNFTDGASLGDSSQYEKIPLTNEQPGGPPLPGSDVTAVTAATSTLNGTTVSTTAAGTINSTLNVSTAINVNAPTEAVDSTMSTTVSTANTNNFSVGSTPPTESSASVTTVSSIASTPSTASRKNTMEGSEISNTMLYTPAVTTSSSTTSTPTTTPNTTSTVSTTAATTTTVSTTAATTTAVSTTTATTTTTTTEAAKATEAPTSPETTVRSIPDGVMETTAGVTKSRGKYRTQLDEMPLPTEPSTTSTTLIPTSSTSGRKNSKPYTSTNGTDDVEGPAVGVPFEKYGVTRMHMLYTAIALIVLHVAFSFLFFLCSATRHSAVVAAATPADRKGRQLRPKTKTLFVALLFIFYLVYVGAEVSYGQFLASFALDCQLKLSTSTANYVTTTFWASFAATRFVSIFVAHFSNPTTMLIVNMGLSTTGSIILCIAGQSSEIVLYMASALIGIGMASTFATGFLWTETHLVVTNRIASAFSVASAIGEMIFPAATGALMEKDSMALMYVLLLANVLTIATFTGAWFVSNHRRRCPSPSNDSGYQLARQGDDDSGIDLLPDSGRRPVG